MMPPLQSRSRENSVKTLTPFEEGLLLRNALARRLQLAVGGPTVLLTEALLHRLLCFPRERVLWWEAGLGNQRLEMESRLWASFPPSL